MVGNDMFAFVKSDEMVMITVPDYASIDDIATLLSENGIIKYSAAFKLYAKSVKDDGKFVAGEYTVSPSMDYEDLLAAFKEKKSTGTTKIMIPEGYTVELLLIDDLKLNDSVKIYRDSDHDSDSCIGSGKTSWIAPEAITAEGYVLACHVTDGQVVSRGDLLFEIVPDQLENMQGGAAAAVMPEEGVLLSVSAQSGAQTAQDAVLATYCPAGEMEVICWVDEDDLPDIEIGQRVKVTLEAYESGAIDGEITAIAAAANEQDEYEVTINLRDMDNVRIGMSATVTF